MKLVSLMSSGIDSPVATYLLSKTTEEMIIIHADNRPFVDDRELENFIAIAKHLKKQVPSGIKAYIVPHGNAISAYIQNCNRKFTCVFCKRMLVRYAKKILQKENAEAIIMGDSLGQVASQTLQNIRVVEQAVDVPILRPLIGLDKEEVVQLAKRIGTYDLSILPTDGCNAVPDKPSTNTKLAKIIFEEQKIDVDKLVNESIKNSKLLDL